MENKEKLYKIGEVARMFNISMGTIRHYEKEGLLEPEYIDEQTGYRYYSVKQFEVLNTIRYLRVLDIPLDEIKEFITNRDIDSIEEKLIRQKEIIAKKQHELELISRKIDNRLAMLKDATSSKLDEISLINVPAQRIVWIKNSLKLESYLDLEYSIRELQKNQPDSLVFPGKVGVGISEKSLKAGRYDKYETAFLLLDDEDEYDGETEFIGETMCVSVRFCGSHKQSPEYYRKLTEYISSHNYVISGYSRELTLIDYGLTSDTSRFVTQINIPVRKK